MPLFLRRFVVRAALAGVALASPALARAQTPPDGGADKNAARQKSGQAAPASGGGFVFPPPSGTLTGTVAGASRGVAVPPPASKPPVKPAASAAGARPAPP